MLVHAAVAHQRGLRVSTLAAAGWVQVAGALAAGLLRLVEQHAESFAADVAATVIADAIGQLPLSIRGAALPEIAKSLVVVVAQLLRLSDAHERALVEALGRVLTERAAADLAREVDKLTATMGRL